MSEGNKAADAVARADRYETFIEFGGWAVVIGVAVELLVLIVFSEMGWQAVLSGAADVLIGGGVFAEIHFGRKLKAASEIIRLDADSRVAAANERAATGHTA